MPKIPILDLNKSFALYSKGRHFSITKFDILVICNILHFEMDFGNLH